MEGALLSLLWGAFAPSIPVVIVVSVLLTAILYNRLDNSTVFLPMTAAEQSANSLLYALGDLSMFESSGGDSAYYLKQNNWTNPAVLHMISSWSEST
jgi:hypothetical protein